MEPALHIRPVTTDAERLQALEIRRQVFCGEQACPPEEEFDEHDEPGAACRHVLGFVDGEPVATARWRVVDLDGRPAAKLERFAVLPAWRGGGRGRALVAWVLEDARRAGHAVFLLHAQAHLERFYASFGFTTVGELFEEAGIPHVKMVKLS